MIALRRTRTSPIGLQLGPRSVALVQMTGPRERPEVYALAHGELPVDAALPDGKQDGEIAAAIRRLVADHRFRGRQVVSCLGAQDLFVQNVRLPQLPPEEVEGVLRWEAEERLPFPAVEAELRHIPAGNVRQDTAVKQEVILMACQKTVLRRHVGILEQAGLVPLAIDVEPCAVLRSLRSAAGRDGPRRGGYLNIGDSAITVVFAEGDQILFLKYIPGGGQQLDQAVARQMNLDLADAARMRSAVTSAATLDGDNDLHRSVIDAIRGPLETMMADVELCLRYYKVTFRGKPLDRITLTGSEAGEWMAEFVAERLAVGCELGNPFAGSNHRSGGAAALDRPWRWSTAVGLSMKR